MFAGASSTAHVAPSAAPVLPQAGEEDDERHRGEPAQRELDAQSRAETPPGMPTEVWDTLKAMGIDIPTGANVQVSSQTTELSGLDALKMLGQLGTFFRHADFQAPLQVHSGVQIVADGRLQASPEHLKAHGLDAQARVKDLEEKQVAFGDLHIVKLTLEVTRPGEPPYEVTTGAFVPTKVTEEFAEGKTFAAKVDPSDRNQVLVVWD